ncbi:9136_t:CDS:2 [Diversispora eburnea]|uniref:9136_t:CDS:1 n=1 Tax=Diversispora eburnea TaxID=1213867 RepID=A0A9N9C115_9GLOM|nr:9136_t:CDS:2 [Diversispora eburnea]
MAFKNFLVILLFFVSVLNADSPKNIIDTIKDQPSLTTLSYLISQASEEDIAILTNNNNSITLFAPNNDAIQLVEIQFLSQPDTLLQTVNYHLVNGSFSDTSLGELNYLPTFLNSTKWVQLGGKPQYLVVTRDKDNNIDVNYGMKSVNAPSKVIGSGIQTSNGYIYIIDTVLQIPKSLNESLVDSGKYPNFLKYISKIESIINNSTNGVTIFLPDDNSFAATIKDYDDSKITDTLNNLIITSPIYLGNLTDGQKIQTLGSEETISIKDGVYYVGNTKITISDILISNGVVHVTEYVVGADNVAGKNNNSSSNDGDSIMTNLMFSLILVSFTILFTL